MRDRADWQRLWSDEEAAYDAANPQLAPCCTLPKGELDSYLSSGWCRLEVLAALCPKRTLRGRWRQGPLNTRFRYHHAPDNPGTGPRITAEALCDPLEGRFTNDSDRELIPDIVAHIAVRYAEYKRSGSDAWRHTVDMGALPEWLEVAGTTGARAVFQARVEAGERGVRNTAIMKIHPDPDVESELAFSELE